MFSHALLKKALQDRTGRDVRFVALVAFVVYFTVSRTALPPFVPKSNWHSRDTARFSHPICSNLIPRSGVRARASATTAAAAAAAVATAAAHRFLARVDLT